MYRVRIGRESFHEDGGNADEGDAHRFQLQLLDLTIGPTTVHHLHCRNSNPAGYLVWHIGIRADNAAAAEVQCLLATVVAGERMGVVPEVTGPARNREAAGIA